MSHIIGYVPIAKIALFFLAKWGNRSYIRITNDAKKIFQKLEGGNH